jgi:hypothetical protein
VQKVSEILPEKYHKILDSILPGGDNWQEGDRECIKSCPYHSSCEFWGPSRKLCSDEWRTTPLKPMALMVIKHVFDNFDFYNTKDLPYSENAIIISEIREILEFPFDESLSPAEIQSVVKVRLRQAEFKKNLFSLWGGAHFATVKLIQNTWWHLTLCLGLSLQTKKKFPVITDFCSPQTTIIYSIDT